jgi:quercetin dioxygenase-like cupin family protein
MGDAMTSIVRASLRLTALAALLLASAAAAQPNTVHKTTLQDAPFPPPAYHSATVRTVVDPGGEVAPHTHPGVEMGYVLEGNAVLSVRGQPPRSLAAGDSFSIPPRTVHSVKNAGPGALTMLSTYVVLKGQPIASPAP